MAEQSKLSIPPISILSYIGAVVFVGLGLHKLLVYVSPDSRYEDPVNVYVGGDAYNYIINMNFATAYFILALILVVFGSSFLIAKQVQLASTMPQEASLTERTTQ